MGWQKTCEHPGYSESWIYCVWKSENWMFREPHVQKTVNIRINKSVSQEQRRLSLIQVTRMWFGTLFSRDIVIKALIIIVFGLAETGGKIDSMWLHKETYKLSVYVLGSLMDSRIMISSHICCHREPISNVLGSFELLFPICLLVLALS